MPKFIGWTPMEIRREDIVVVDLGSDKDLLPEARAFLANETQRVSLGTLRAMAKRGFLPATTEAVAAVLCTKDKGGPGRLAKRWYSWFAPKGAYQRYREENPLRRR